MKRLALIIFDILIVVISAIAIMMYFTYPFFKVELSFDIGTDEVEWFLDEYRNDLSDYVDVDTIDVDGVMDGQTYTIGITLNIDSMRLIESVSQNQTESYVTEIINDNVDPLVDSLVDILVKVVQSVATTEVTSVTKSYLTDYLNSGKTGDEAYTDEEIQAILDNAGITDEYISEEVNSIMQAVSSDNATVESVTDAVMDVVEDVYQKAVDSGVEELADIELDEETKQQIRDEVEDIISELADEDGSVSIDTVLSKLLDALKDLNGGNYAQGDDEEAKAGRYAAMNAVVTADNASTSNQSSEDVRAELKLEITSTIMSYLTDDVIQICDYVFMGLAALLLFSCFTWAYVIIKIIIKIFCKNPGVKLKLPIILGWIPFLLFYAAPTFGLPYLLKAVELPEIVTVLLSSMTFATSGMYAFIAAIVLIVVWIPYGMIRRRRKKELKAKKED